MEQIARGDLCQRQQQQCQQTQRSEQGLGAIQQAFGLVE